MGLHFYLQRAGPETIELKDIPKKKNQIHEDRAFRIEGSKAAEVPNGKEDLFRIPLSTRRVNEKSAKIPWIK
jgi:hypothetical protein